MINKSSLGNRLIALTLCVVMVLGMVPANVFAQESSAVAKVGDTNYQTLAEAIAAVPTGTNQVKPTEATTVTLLKDTAYAFDVGKSTGSTTMNLKLDLNGKTLTLAPSVGSVDTKSNGIRVLAYSKLEIVNGIVVCSSETADNVKVGIANYGELVLDDVDLQAGDLTLYTINNRGALTLKGETKVTEGVNSVCAITNDPYNLYYTTDVDASVTCDSSEVSVDSVLVERYARESDNQGGVKLNISAGYFGQIVEDGKDAVSSSYNVTGGTIGVSTTEELEFALSIAKAGDAYACPQQPVTIKLLNDLAGSFDVGISTGKAPKNILLDLNEKTLTLAPSVGSVGTKSNGIRVLAYSKLEIKNGNVVCSSETVDNVKVGIANYGELVLDDVDLQAGDLTLYTINNRGALTLKGETKVTEGANSVCAITNDPYDLYYKENVDASVTCDSSEVSVDSVLVERYARESDNQGGVKLNISAGYFGKIEEDNNTAVSADYKITGGEFGSDISDFCSDGYQVVRDENNNYVVKSAQTGFGFAEETYSVTFGANGNKFTATVKNAKGEITYSVVTGTDVAQINEQTGELTILKAGTVQVKAVAAGNAQYIGAEDTYTLVINPAYADVYSFSGGTITGSGSDDTVVSIDQATLEWVEKDESIGRMQDGWWVGIKIVAPEGVDLSKAVYQRRSGGSFDGAEVKTFVPTEDRYMGMWGLVTAEYLENFIQNDKKMNYVWRFSWDGDDIYEQTIAITIDPNGIVLKQSGFAYGNGEETITYGSDYTARVPSGGQASTITYSVENVSESDTPIAQIDSVSGVLTVNKAGTVKITATKSGAHFESISASYTLIINPAKQTASFAQSAPEITYAPNLIYSANVLENVQGTVTYSIINEDVNGSGIAIIDTATGALSIEKAGKVTVQAEVTGNDCYKAGTVAYTLTVKEAQQVLKFASAAVEKTYNENGNKFTQTVTGNKSDKSVVYTSSNPAVATVDANSGEVTFVTAGEVTITANCAGDGKYADAEAVSYTLKIKPAKHDISYAETAVDLIYGTEEYFQIVTVGTLSGVDAEVTYALSGDTYIAKEFDATTGKITFADKKVGTVTVTATKAADACYELTSVDYTIQVSWLATDAKPVVEDIWHTGQVTVKAPAEYQISKDGTLSENWADEVVFDTADGNNQSETVYLCDGNGNITDAITVSGIKVDKVNPENLQIQYSAPLWEVVLEYVTFGIYRADTLEVTVSAEDVTSGIASLTYTYADQTKTVTFEDVAQASTSFELPTNFRGEVTLIAVDAAGRITQKTSETTIVLDTTHPALGEVGYIYDAEAEPREYSNILYTQDAVTMVFTINESNANLSDLEKIIAGVATGDKTVMPVLTVNGNAAEVDWDIIDSQIIGSYKVSGDGEYILCLNYTDAAGNPMDEWCREIHLDAAPPEITITDKDDNAAFAGEISNTNKTAVITITEDNFNPEEVELTVIAEDILGNEVLVADYTADAKNRDNWTSVADDVYALELNLTEDAVYQITVNYKDLAVNAAPVAEDTLIVDKLAPTQPVITYSNGSVGEKLLELLSFGFFKAPLHVTIVSSDATSGVSSITYQYDGVVGRYDGTDVTGQDTVLVDANNSITFTLPDAFYGTVTAIATDIAGNDSAEQSVGNTAEDTYDGVVVDSVAPNVNISYEGTLEATILEKNNGELSRQDVTAGADARFVYSSGVVGTITVDEDNFYEEDITVIVTRDDQDVTSEVVGEWSNVLNTSVFTKTIDMGVDGDYVVTVRYTDASGNEMEWSSNAYANKTGVKEYQSNVITVDTQKPEMQAVFDDADTVIAGKYFDHTREAQISIRDRNFRPNEVKLEIVAKDINGESVNYTYEPLTTWEDWELQADGITWIAKVPFDKDANYQMNLTYQDIARNAVQSAYSTEFVVDTKEPEALSITYSEHELDNILNLITFGYYQAEKTVTLSATDLTAGVRDFALTVTPEGYSSATDVALPQNLVISADGSVVSGETGFINNIVAQQVNGTVTISFKVPAQFRGDFAFTATDNSQNYNSTTSEKVLVVDTIAPTRTVSYQPERILDAQTLLDVQNFSEGDNVILYYKNSAVVTFVVNEANFYSEDVKIKVNGVEKAPTDWKRNDDDWTGTVTISGNGDYIVTMSYVDRSRNEMVEYTSQKIAIDSAVPTIQISYKDLAEAKNTNYYKADRTATITVTEHNFRADDVAAAVTAVDVQGNLVSVEDYTSYLSNRDNWKYWDAEGNLVSDAALAVNPDEHVAQITYSTDAAYTFDIAYTDLIGNAAESKHDAFVVDHVVPTTPTITYTEPVIEKVIEALTFGFYQPSVTVTLTAEDVTAGVDYFQWNYTKQADSSDKNTADYGATITTDKITYSDDGKIATAEFTIPANARGYISADVTDRAGNSSAKKVDDTIIRVVDELAPEISVAYEANSSSTKVQFVDQADNTVDSFAKGTKAFYNGDVTAKISINEANFFEGVTATDGVIHLVGIKLTKTDDLENVSVFEYLPEGAAQMYPDAKPVYINWKTAGDVHTIEIPYSDNADYILEIAYTDFSENDSKLNGNDGVVATKTYTSKQVTVDKVAPVVEVTYENTKVINTIDERKYFDDVQSAVIIVKEHNFRAEDIAAVVTAKNIIDQDVVVADFAAQLADKKNWVRDGNVYTAVVNYTDDANYTFDIDFVDLAQNFSADYQQDLFTVDTRDPYNLTVDYRTSVPDQIMESLSLGYYNAMLTVTITAEDETSGVHYFDYSYIKSENVSDVNAELLNQIIKEAEITSDGKTFSAEFNIPKKVLGNDNQFKGTVEFTAYDRSENNLGMKDSSVIVVDNIAPTAKITYNAPVQNTNGISYYNGNIHATIEINEANFDSKDVVVSVVKDGAKYPVNVSWKDDSLDIHTGTFTLSSDGDYFVSVEYQDKSGNKMTSYKSNELTLDATKPTIKVSNIKANSANKDEKYGFVITVDDTNMNVSAIKPVLKAVVEKEEGIFVTVDIDLGEAKTVVQGQTYSYTVEDLPDDGLYTLTCEVKDMSANTTSQIMLDDGQNYEQVQFSINRKGSTFGYGNLFAEELIGKYYIYSVDEDVVIVEVNVDPIEMYKVTLNGKELVEGTDYTSVQTSKVGEWSKRTYTINKSLFETEGEYSIIVSSTDKSETTAFSDIKNLSMAFVVDQTKPVLTITGLETGGRYQTEAQTVTLIPTDEGGRLNSLTVLVLDSNGDPLKDDKGTDISVRFEMSGEELLKYLEENDGKVTFTVPEGLNNQVQIICDDCAVNADDLANEYNELFKRVTVSQNRFVIFYADTPLFVGTIVGVLAVIALIIFLIKRRGNKKNKSAAKA